MYVNPPQEKGHTSIGLNKQQDDGRRHILNFAKKKKEKQNEICH
jgi:hypothetical protein